MAQAEVNAAAPQAVVETEESAARSAEEAAPVAKVGEGTAAAKPTDAAKGSTTTTEEIADEVNESDEDGKVEQAAQFAAFEVELQQSSLPEHHQESIKQMLRRKDSSIRSILMRYDSLEALQAGEEAKARLESLGFVPPCYERGMRDLTPRVIEEQVNQAQELRFKDLQAARKRKSINNLRAKSRQHVTEARESLDKQGFDPIAPPPRTSMYIGKEGSLL